MSVRPALGARQRSYRTGVQPAEKSSSLRTVFSGSMISTDHGCFGRSMEKSFPTTYPLSSGLQGLQISDTLDRQIPGLFDEVILYAAGLGCGENLGPVQAVFSYG